MGCGGGAHAVGLTFQKVVPTPVVRDGSGHPTMSTRLLVALAWSSLGVPLWAPISHALGQGASLANVALQAAVACCACCAC